jgi:hypothetical protein
MMMCYYEKPKQVSMEQEGAYILLQGAYKSAYELERDELAAALEFLEGAVELLQKRLHPVMVDQPQRTADPSLCSATASPVVAAITEAKRRVSLCSINLRDMIERLEI